MRSAFVPHHRPAPAQIASPLALPPDTSAPPAAPPPPGATLRGVGPQTSLRLHHVIPGALNVDSQWPCHTPAIQNLSRSSVNSLPSRPHCPSFPNSVVPEREFEGTGADLACDQDLTTIPLCECIFERVGQEFVENQTTRQRCIDVKAAQALNVAFRALLDKRPGVRPRHAVHRWAMPV